ncbi:MAG TPA: MdtA/MuxA family multidrug efflux RND transporter periplasmic adaptor subunit [Vicinamibacterales bacterium]|jgi:multidrug efflux system membrane fusion protein
MTDRTDQHESTTTTTAHPPRSRGLIWFVLLLMIVGVAGYAVWRAGQPASAQRAQAGGGGGGGGRGGGRGSLGPVPVVVATVGRSSIPVYLQGLGNVTAFYTVTIKSRVDGQLMKVDFQEGDFVKAGQVLAEIDPRPYQVMLESAQATLAKDQALLDNARVDFDRYKKLLETDAVPKQQLDTQTALVEQYKAAIQQDAAAVDNAKLQLVYAKVTAPISGVAGLRLVDPGNIVHASDPGGMVVITQLQPIAVLFTIPEDSLPQITQRLRAGAHLEVDAYNRDNSKKLASGTLTTVDNQIDNTTGTSKLKAVFDNKDFLLFPQQFVNIHLLVDSLQNQLVVPNVAVQNGQQGTFVYVVDDSSRVHLKTVQVGKTTETSSDITSGIVEGDRVVVDGTDRLVENAIVRVRKAGELDNTDAPAGDGSGGRGQGGRGRRGDAAATNKGVSQ